MTSMILEKKKDFFCGFVKKINDKYDANKDTI